MDFNFTLVGLDGQPILSGTEPANAGKTLATQLYGSNLPDLIKWNDLSRKLYAGEYVVLDKSDQDKLRKFIESSQLINGVKEQLLNIIK